MQRYLVFHTRAHKKPKNTHGCQHTTHHMHQGVLSKSHLKPSPTPSAQSELHNAGCSLSPLSTGHWHQSRGHRNPQPTLQWGQGYVSQQCPCNHDLQLLSCFAEWTYPMHKCIALATCCLGTSNCNATLFFNAGINYCYCFDHQ